MKVQRTEYLDGVHWSTETMKMYFIDPLWWRLRKGPVEINGVLEWVVRYDRI